MSWGNLIGTVIGQSETARQQFKAEAGTDGKFSRAELRHALRAQIDQNHDRKIDAQEMKILISSLGIQPTQHSGWGARFAAMANPAKISIDDLLNKSQEFLVRGKLDSLSGKEFAASLKDEFKL